MKFLHPLLAFVRRLRRGPVRRTICKANRVRLGLERLESKDVPSGTWTQISLPAAASQGLGDMVLLDDGEVFGQAGTSAQWLRLAPDSSGNYFDGTWTTAAAMSTWRERFASNDLPDGRVVGMGGENPGSTNPFLSSAEIYDPAANTFTSLDSFPDLGNPTGQGSGPSPTALIPGNPSPDHPRPDGQLLVGYFWGSQTYLLDPTQPGGQTPPAQWVATTSGRCVDPSSHAQDANGEESYVLLPDDNVLAYDLSRSHTSPLSFTADQYISSSGQWVDASGTEGAPPQSLAHYEFTSGGLVHENGAPLLLPPSTAFPGGAVFWLGGDGNTAYFDISTGKWTAGPTIPDPSGSNPSGDPGGSTTNAPAAELPNGHIIVATGTVYDNGPYALYDFDPNAGTNGTFTPMQPSPGVAYPNLAPAAALYDMSMLDLPNGHLLFSISSSSTGNQLWDYAPDPPPAGIATPQVLGIGQYTNGVFYNNGLPNADGSYDLSGKYLTGFSEGAAQGDEFNGSATNYPIVKLTLGTRVWYAPTTGWTPGVDDPTQQYIKFTLPAGLPNEDFQVQVVASGIASAPYVNPLVHNSGPAVVYADSSWTSLAPGTPVVPNATGAPGRMGAIGDITNSSATGNCFATLSDAISRAVALGGATVVVNGANGASGSGQFSENVVMNSLAPLFLQNGGVDVGTLASDPNDLSPAAEQIAVGESATLEIGDASHTSSNGQYGGAIIGAGSVDLTGGVLPLAGTDTVYGTTTVTSGTLAVTGTIGRSGGLPGQVVVNGGTLAVGAANALAGSTVTLNPGGVVDLSGVSAATFGALQGSGALGIGAATLTVGGDGQNTTFSGSISGTGAFVKGFGSETLTLGGPVMTTGGLEIAAGGNLVPGTASALAGVTVTIDHNGDLDLQRIAAATLGGLAGVGSLSYSGTNLSVGSDGAPTTFSGDFDTSAGSGVFTKIGSGTLTLASNSYFSTLPPVVVDTGTLVVDGYYNPNQTGPSTVTVLPGAELEGTGTINDVVNVAGTLAPGTAAALGTPLTADKVVFNSNGANGICDVTLNSPSVGYGALVALNNVDLTGATLNLMLTPGYTPQIGDQFDVAHSVQGARIGAFAGLPSSGAEIEIGGSYFALTYSGGDVKMTAVPPPVPTSQVNDGSAQRSQVRSISLIYPTVVLFEDDPTGRLLLQRTRDATGPITPQSVGLTASTSVVNGTTVVTLTFSGSATDPLSVTSGGEPVPGPSLADGLYVLTGDGFATPANGSGPGLYRLYGDADGSGVDNANDFALFRLAYGSGSSDPSYVAYLDFDANGAINAFDFAEFRLRLGDSVLGP